MYCVSRYQFSYFLLGFLPSWDIDFGPDDLDYLRCDDGSDFSAHLQRHSEGICIDESSRVCISGAGGIHRLRRPCLDEMILFPTLYHGTILADLDNGDFAFRSDFVQSLTRFLSCKSSRLSFVREDNVHVILYYIMKEGKIIGEVRPEDININQLYALSMGDEQV